MPRMAPNIALHCPTFTGPLRDAPGWGMRASCSNAAPAASLQDKMNTDTAGLWGSHQSDGLYQHCPKHRNPSTVHPAALSASRICFSNFKPSTGMSEHCNPTAASIGSHIPKGCNSHQSPVSREQLLPAIKCKQSSSALSEPLSLHLTCSLYQHLNNN